MQDRETSQTNNSKTDYSQKDIFSYLSENSKEFPKLYSTHTANEKEIKNPILFFNNLNHDHESQREYSSLIHRKENK
ncbi:MAG: hypothetical protein H0W64_11690 [Gammaproteobacteria bacterium]|nr:hypothetical protein [Gammaproteobacteria bacterium]